MAGLGLGRPKLIDGIISDGGSAPPSARVQLNGKVLVYSPPCSVIPSGSMHSSTGLPVSVGTARDAWSTEQPLLSTQFKLAVTRPKRT